MKETNERETMNTLEDIHKNLKINNKICKYKKILKGQEGITLISFAISRKCVRYEERA